jgi:hypothetical protein
MITFAGDPDICLWEKETTPPSQEGGTKIDTTTFHNQVYRTAWPRSLIEIGDGRFLAAYDPAVRPLLVAQLNVNQEITVTYNDGSTDAFWGALNTFVPQPHAEGDQPEAEVTFIITNADSTFLEAGPANASISGT